MKSLAKKIVCRCQDITEEEIIEVISSGYTDPESLKRYTGVSTGPCQGKGCLTHVIAILARELKKKPWEIRIPTQRQPTKPVFLSVLAGESSK